MRKKILAAVLAALMAVPPAPYAAAEEAAATEISQAEESYLTQEAEVLIAEPDGGMELPAAGQNGLQEPESQEPFTETLSGETELQEPFTEGQTEKTGTEGQTEEAGQEPFTEGQTEEAGQEPLAEELPAETELQDGFITAIEVVETQDYALNGAESEELLTDADDALAGTLSVSGIASEASLPPVALYAAAASGQTFGAQLSGTDAVVYQAFEQAYAAQWQTGSLKVTLPQSITFFLKYTYDENGQKDIEDRETNASYQEASLTLIWALQAALDAFAYDHPEVFWLNSFSYHAPITYTVSPSEYNGTIKEITFTPKESYPSAKNEVSAFRSAVDRAVSEISAELQDGNGTKAETALAVHDYICDRAVYQDNTYAHSAGGFFLHGGYVVCEGYAKAFKILCNRLGVESILVVGDAGGPHMWNYVNLENGNWYLVDVTWDDQSDATWYTYFLAGSNTVSWSQVTIGEERVLYTNFSSSENSVNFSYPYLSGQSYFEDAGHLHIWSVAEEKLPTCTEEGYTLYRCICGETSRERRSALGHSYRKKNYVYNNDATCLSDGTKTAVCDNGCGMELHTVYAAGTKLAPTMEVNVSSLKLKKKQSTDKLKVSGLGPGDYVKSWSTSDSSIAKVSGAANGTCTVKAGKKTGKAEITIVLASGLSKTVKVKVQKDTVKTKKITGIPKKLTLQKKEKYLLAAVVKPITSGEKITYSSSNKKVATVNAKGKIKAKKKGKTVITVKSGNKKVKCTVTVK